MTMPLIRRMALDWDHVVVIMRERLGERLSTDRPLSNFNTFGTGGNARLFVEVQSAEELVQVVRAAAEVNIPYFMLGGGSNLLVSDQGYDGLIIKNSIMGMEKDGTSILAGAGEQLQALVNFATQQSLTGLEFAAGIWGTVGGAVYGNAGAYGADVSAVLESAQVVDKLGNMRTEQASYFEFGYRDSKLKRTGEFVTRARFALIVGNKDEIQAKIEDIVAQRNQRLPVDGRSAGCFFKNVVDKNMKYGKLPAGQLLEEIGAKEMHYGGARVFQNHANIIVNDGGASSTDIWRLAQMLKRSVKERFGLELKEEITYLGDFNKECV